MVKQVAIILCDNDYQHPLSFLVEGLILLYKNKKGFESEEQFVKIFQAAIPYFVYFDNDIPNVEEVSNYLISQIKFKFNYEAFEFAQNNNHDGGSYYVDFENGQFTSF